MIWLYEESRGSERNARRDCWTSIIPQLIEMGVTGLYIERVGDIEINDKTSISDALAKTDALGVLSYTHVRPQEEPLLWFADAIAWAHGAGGHWTKGL